MANPRIALSSMCILCCHVLNILIVKMSAIGDVIHTLPALTTLRRHLPDAHITWLVEPVAADLIGGHPALDRMIVWPRREWIAALKGGRFITLTRGVRRFMSELRDTRYDLVIDFQALAKSALWVMMTRGKRKAGYGPGMRHDELSYLALNERVTVGDPTAHAVERNLRLLEGLGYPRLPLQYDLPLAAEDDDQALRLLREVGVNPDAPFIAIHAMTRWPTKNWTTAGFAEVRAALASRGVASVFTGAPGDEAALDAIGATKGAGIKRLDGRTSLRTLAAVFRRATVVLSTDSGPMHLAVAAGTAVVALFGPTSPDYTGPYGEGHEILRVGVECSPCYRRICKTTRYEKEACMRRIQPSDVVAAVMQQMQTRQPTSRA